VTKLLLAALLREARRLKHAATLSAIDKADGSESSQDATGVIPELRTDAHFDLRFRRLTSNDRFNSRQTRQRSAAIPRFEF